MWSFFIVFTSKIFSSNNSMKTIIRLYHFLVTNPQRLLLTALRIKATKFCLEKEVIQDEGPSFICELLFTCHSIYSPAPFQLFWQSWMFWTCKVSCCFSHWAHCLPHGLFLFYMQTQHHFSIKPSLITVSKCHFIKLVSALPCLFIFMAVIITLYVKQLFC